MWRSRGALLSVDKRQILPRTNLHRPRLSWSVFHQSKVGALCGLPASNLGYAFTPLTRTTCKSHWSTCFRSAPNGLHFFSIWCYVRLKVSLVTVISVGEANWGACVFVHTRGLYLLNYISGRCLACICFSQATAAVGATFPNTRWNEKFPLDG